MQQDNDWVIIDSVNEKPEQRSVDFDIFEEQSKFDQSHESKKSKKTGETRETEILEVVESGNVEENVMEIVLDEEGSENGEGGVIVIVVMLILMAYAVCKR